MKKKIWIVLVIAVIAMAATARTRPVLLSLSPDPTELRPRNYCVMNPFRDRAPERASERFLMEMRAGQPQVLAAVLTPESRDQIIDMERKFPVKGWRIGRRRDTAETTELMYWVQRGNGYSARDVPEEVYFVVARSASGARVTGYGAIY
jgi:hypothetical protein